MLPDFVQRARSRFDAARQVIDALRRARGEAAKQLARLTKQHETDRDRADTFLSDQVTRLEDAGSDDETDAAIDRRYAAIDQINRVRAALEECVLVGGAEDALTGVEDAIREMREDIKQSDRDLAAFEQAARRGSLL